MCEFTCALELFWVKNRHYFVCMHKGVEYARPLPLYLVLSCRNLSLQICNVFFQQFNINFATLATLLGSMVVASSGRVYLGRAFPIGFVKSSDLRSQLTYPLAKLIFFEMVLRARLLFPARLLSAHAAGRRGDLTKRV